VHICVDHDEEDGLEASAPVGNIYTSDTLMEMFGLSQRRTFRPHNFAVDFMRVAVCKYLPTSPPAPRTSRPKQNAVREDKSPHTANPHTHTNTYCTHIDKSTW
jgi:hypothetical protein